MRHLMMGTAIALVCAAPAYAEPSIYAEKDAGAYVGIEGGMWFPDKLKTETDFGNGYGFDYDVERDVGYDIDVIAGYDFGMIRLEGELGYKRVKHGDGTITIVNNGTVIGEDEDNDGGRTSVWSAMGNVLLDFGGPDNLNLFVGGGIGVAKVKVRSDFFAGAYKESGFAWQLLAGARYPVNRNIDVGLKYRYADLGDHRESEGSANFRVDNLRSHSLLLGLIYNFGAAPPPPPPPPPPPMAPPPPATQTCPDGSVILASDACPPPPPPPPPPPEPERG